MLQPCFWAALLLAPLLVGTVAGAQPQPAPSQRQVIQSREVVLSSDAAGPVPVVRLAPRVRTYIAFDTFIVPDSVRLEKEGTRVRLVDVGRETVILEGLAELGADGALLRASYADGMAPQEVTLSLVSDAEQVDKEVEVKRRPRSFAAMQAELAATRARCEAQGAQLAALQARCDALGPGGLALAGVLDGSLKKLELRTGEIVSSALNVTRGWAVLTDGWTVVAAWVTNSAPAPWTPRGARLNSLEPGGGVTGLPVRMKGAQLAPGEAGLVVVEADSRFPDAFRLEVLDAQGRTAFFLTTEPATEARGAHGK